MKNAAWCVVAVALGMVAGCGGNARPATDGGVTTPDTGTTPGNDAGMQVDAFMMSGPCGSWTANFQPLPAGCLPRCSAATLAAVGACAQTDTACIQAALTADTTPAATIMAGTQSIMVTCAGSGSTVAGCINVQGIAAEAMFCNAELTAFAQCLNAHGGDATMCATESTARETCNTTNETAIGTAANSLIEMCFAN